MMAARADLHRRVFRITRRQALVGLIATLATPRAAPAASYVDMAGRTVTLPAPPGRIVCLVPSVTELIFALGAEALLVGVTDFCDHPPGARAKRSVGGMIAPSLETVVTLRPDLVIVTSAGNRHETFTQFARLGIPVYEVHADSLARVMELAGRLGDLTGRQAAVAALKASLERRIDVVARAVAGRPRPRVLYVMWPDPLMVPGRAAIISELIALAGGESVTASEPGDYVRFSVEAAVARAPDVILLARHGAGTGAIRREGWDRLASLPAVKHGRVHAVDGDILHRYGPRIVDGLEELVRLIHPGAPR